MGSHANATTRGRLDMSQSKREREREGGVEKNICVYLNFMGGNGNTNTKDGFAKEKILYDFKAKRKSQLSALGNCLQGHACALFSPRGARRGVSSGMK